MTEGEFGFTGHYYHTPSNLHFAAFRGYDSSQGRWINRDPLSENGGLNLYAYADGDPINKFDPDGRHPIIIGYRAIKFGIAVVGFLILWQATTNRAVQQACKSINIDEISRWTTVGGGFGTGGGPKLRDNTGEGSGMPGTGGAVVGGGFGSGGTSVQGYGGAVGGGREIVEAPDTLVLHANSTGGKTPLWTSTRSKTPAENAFEHWQKHGAEFPEFQNATQ